MVRRGEVFDAFVIGVCYLIVGLSVLVVAGAWLSGSWVLLLIGSVVLVVSSVATDRVLDGMDS